MASANSGRPESPPSSLRKDAVGEPRRARHGRIRDDHPVDAAGAADAHDIVEVGEPEIGRDLEQDRLAAVPFGAMVTGVEHAGEEIVERRRLLQVAQSRRVRRGNIDGEIARDIGEGGDAFDIIGNAVGTRLVRPDIDADDPAAAAAREPPMHRAMAFAVEAEAVDHRLVVDEPEQARRRIARLRARRDRADFDMAEAETQQAIDHFAALVEPRRHAERIGKIKAEGGDGKARIGLGAGHERQHFQRGDRRPMRAFRFEREKNGPRQRAESPDHGSSPAKS